MNRLIVLLAITCAGCEALLGFGDTSLSAPGDVSLGTGDDARSDGGPDDVGIESSSDTSSDVVSEQVADDAIDVTKRGDEVPRDVGADVEWSPSSIPGLVLWLDAAVGLQTAGGKISSWKDQSPHQNDAVSMYPDLRPLLVSPGIGSYPGVAFPGDGSILVVHDNPSLRFGTTGFVVEVVMRHRTRTDNPLCLNGYGPLFAKQSVINPFPGPALFVNYPLTPQAGLAAQLDLYTVTSTADGVAYNDDRPRVVGIYYSVASVLSLRVNGNPAGIPFQLAAPVDVDAIGSDMYIGAHPDKEQCVDGVIAEMVAAARVTPEETLALERYLLRKYETALKSD